jgi:phage I-like protein
MIQDTIAEIEARLRQGGLEEPKREELLRLLDTLKAEVAGLSQTHAAQAQSIAGFTAVSTHEATREEKNPHLVQLSLKGLASSVEEFEASHPRLVEVVNRICTTLSNLGI